MSTVVKALSLLDHFDASIPEVGLVDMARLSGLDKATARRLLVALGKKGFVEQDPVTRRYRLGAALVRLARIREIALPMLDIARPLVEELSRQCGETVHVSQVAANLLSSVLVCESPHANRVSVAVGQNLPFHCTASGIAFLSATTENFRAVVLKGPLPRMTAKTVTTPAQLKKLIETARERGCAFSDQGLEEFRRFDSPSQQPRSVGTAVTDPLNVNVGDPSQRCPEQRGQWQETIGMHRLPSDLQQQ